MQDISSSAMTANDNNISFFARSQKTTRWSHSPTVYAMIKGSRMDNCDDVAAILRECQATKADDSICNTASMYLKSCIRDH